MLSDQIQNWLTDNGSFKDGYQLYRATGDNRHLAFFTTSLRSAFLPPGAKDRLRTVLGDYLVKNPPLPSSAKSVKTKSVPAPQIVNSEPQEVLSLRARGRHLLKQQSHLRARLSEMTTAHEKYTDDDRYELVLELMKEVVPAIDDVYEKIRRWSEFGEIPQPGTVSSIVKETVEKMQRLAALRSKISRDKRKLQASLPKAEKDALEKGIVTAEAEVLQIQTDLDLIE